MTSDKSKSRGASKSPTQMSRKPESKATKTNGGGVKLPIDEKHPNAAINGSAATTFNGGVIPMKIVNVPNWKGPQQQGGTTAANGNPFEGNPSHEDQNAKLSGGATSFKPKPAPIAFLNQNSTADDAGGPVIVSSDIPSAVKQDKAKGKAQPQQPIGTRGENFSPSRPRVFFTTDVGPEVNAPGGHYIRVMNVPAKEMDRTMKSLSTHYNWPVKVRGTQYSSPAEGSNFVHIFLSFHDTRDAEASFDQIHSVNTNWKVNYVSQVEYANAKRENRGKGLEDATAFYDGQVIFTAQFGGLSTKFSVEGLFDQVKELATRHGEVLAFDETEREGSNWQFRAEYYNIKDAKAVVERITSDDPEYLGEWVITTGELPDYTISVNPGNVHFLENGVHAIVTPQKGTNGVIGIQNVQYSSPTGRTAWRVDENGRRVPAPAPKQLPKTQAGNGIADAMTPQHRHFSEPLPQTPINYMGAYPQGPRSSSWSGPYQPFGATPYSNRQPIDIWGTPTSVDVAKIMNGQDVRTTVMLRNLPNNIGFRDLKQILDTTSFGKYDFSYLRVDFGNNLNVGYGFVNFTGPEHIVPFVDHYVGRPWVPTMRYSRRRGPRIADVSYATVQGYDCLVEKFRNSSVMDEFQDFRPKLWWAEGSTSNQSLIGQEKEFPGPNNESKKQRSRDNATQIGLYASGNRRNRTNNGSRSRHSQYDRGTTAQMQEEAYFNQGWNQMSPLQTGYGYMDAGYMLGGAPMSVGPPPQFPQMGFGNMNGFAPYGTPYTNGAGVIDPMAYGYVQFSDPFSDQYQNVSHIPGRIQNNGRFTGRANQVQSPNRGFQGRAYHCGIASHQIPKAIIEEHSGPHDPPPYSNGQYAYENAEGDPDVNGYNNTYPHQQ